MKKIQYEKRLSGLRAYIEDHGLTGALITSYENRRYFCGFTGSSGYLLVTRDHTVLITKECCAIIIDRTSGHKSIQVGTNFQHLQTGYIFTQMPGMRTDISNTTGFSGAFRVCTPSGVISTL